MREGCATGRKARLGLEWVVLSGARAIERSLLVALEQRSTGSEVQQLL